MTDQEMIDALQPSKTYYDPMYTLPGVWEAETNKQGLIKNIRFPGSDLEINKNMGLLVLAGIFAFLMLQRK